MSDGERAKGAMLARLRGEIAEDRAMLERCMTDARLAKARLGGAPVDPAVLALAAVALHGWYTGLESVLERVARQLDGDVPTGSRWHRELLTQMSVEVPRLRPAVLPRTVIAPLAELLAFRHFFRHAYGIVLDADRIATRLALLFAAVDEVDVALDMFDSFLVEAGVAAE